MVNLNSVNPNAPSTELRVAIEAVVLAALAEGHLGGALHSVFGEDYDLQAMPRSSELRCYMNNIIVPPPFRYDFEVESLADLILQEARTKITDDLARKADDILSYSQECTGLTIPAPKGYVALDDFMDVTRIYLSHIFGKRELPQLLEKVADGVGIMDDDKLKISRLPKAELVLATYFLQQVRGSGLVREVGLVSNDRFFDLSRVPTEFSELGSRYITDVNLLKYPESALELLIPFHRGRFTRVLARTEVRQNELNGRVPLTHFDGFYQLQEL